MVSENSDMSGHSQRLAAERKQAKNFSSISCNSIEKYTIFRSHPDISLKVMDVVERQGFWIILFVDDLRVT